MSPRLVYYHPSVLNEPPHAELPGVRTLSHFRRMFNDQGTQSYILVDRTNTIRTPIRMRSLHPIPQLRPMGKSFEEVCNERATELLARADTLGMPLYVFWSGGIDSTLALISFLKCGAPEQKKNIVVYLTEHSIRENPNFYNDHIRGKLRTDSSARSSYIVGSHAIITNGDPNDSVFGVGTAGRLMDALGSDIIHKPYRREVLQSFFERSVGNGTAVAFYLDLFERLVSTAPVPIVSYFDYLWWLNFTLKWQFACMKMITAAAKPAAPNITPEYTRMQFAPFYNTDDFQLWAMNNMDKRIKDEWRTFKWVCKDIIYDYTKDAGYRDNKVQTGSMRHIFPSERAFKYIDDSMRFYPTLDLHDYYEPDNDFIRS